MQNSTDCNSFLISNFLNLNFKKNVDSLYRVCTEMGKQNSRTIPGLFSFFKDSISSQFCIKQRKKNALFSAENIEVKRLVFFDPDSGDKKRDYRTN